MKRLRLKNFRSLVDTGDVELRPLTVLVGTNSSGKSSFLRFFPLLRQTMESSSRAPLLWCGRLVDFGDFKSAARRHEPSLPIGVEFEMDWINSRCISLEIQGNEQTTWLSACEVRSVADQCRFEFDEAGIVIQVKANGHDFSEEFRKHGMTRNLRQHLIPDLEWDRSSAGAGGRKWGVVHHLVADELANYASRRTKKETLLRHSERLLQTGVRYINDAPKKSPVRAFSAMKSSALERIRAVAFVNSVLNDEGRFDLLWNVREDLNDFALGVTYLGPFRQDPQRYYRHQELSVAQIEPHGENLAMFIRALSDKQVQDLSNFVKKYLGYGVGVRSVGAHVEVFIKEESGAEFNLIDMGYGFSQVLPIIAQCWATSSGLSFQGRTPRTTVLAMEQPELHLHPAHQAKLADMLAGVLQATADRSRDNERSEFTRLIVETHSETLVNRLGELIEKGSLNTTDISVLLFEKDPATGSTSVRICEFNPDGTLTNWPIGFFSP